MAKEMTEYEKKIRIAMLEKGIKTFSELAEMVGIRNTYLSDIISGSRKATVVRQRINDLLGIEAA